MCGKKTLVLYFYLMHNYFYAPRLLSPAINDTTEFSTKLSVQHCEVTSTREAECEAEIVGFQMWNVSVLMHE